MPSSLSPSTPSVVGRARYEGRGVGVWWGTGVPPSKPEVGRWSDDRIKAADAARTAGDQGDLAADAEQMLAKGL